MADEPVTDPPAATPPAVADDGLSADEVKGLIGEALDEKLAGFGANFATKEDMATFRTGILEDITAKMPSLIPAGSSVDEASLLSKVGGMLDDKLKSVGVKTARTPGTLGRWLQGGG